MEIQVGPNVGLPETRCPVCAHKISGAFEFGGDHAPGKGDVAVCAYCGALNVYTDAVGNMRRATDEELAECRAHPELWERLQIAQRALRKVRQPDRN